MAQSSPQLLWFENRLSPFSSRLPEEPVRTGEVEKSQTIKMRSSPGKEL